MPHKNNAMSRYRIVRVLRERSGCAWQVFVDQQVPWCRQALQSEGVTTACGTRVRSSHACGACEGCALNGMHCSVRLEVFFFSAWCRQWRGKSAVVWCSVCKRCEKRVVQKKKQWQARSSSAAVRRASASARMALLAGAQRRSVMSVREFAARFRGPL